MPSISKIRFTNVVYEDGQKRYNDDIFLFDGHNGAILLENGGGKTVFIQTALQAILPHTSLADRKIGETLKLEDAPAHIGIEWILNEQPRRYALTCVSLFLTKNGLDSIRYVYEYGENDDHSLEKLPFTKEYSGKIRASERGEIQEYYSYMVQQYMNAKTFDTIKEYKAYLEKAFHIIPKEWESIVKINATEGGVEEFFNECKTTGQLFDRLLIPTVEEAMVGYQKDGFVETFEKHRDSFKQYKQLKQKIVENEQIKERVAVYVRAFEKYDGKIQNYRKTKEKAKAYLLLAQQQLHTTEENYADLIMALSTWEDQQKQLEQKEASYEIAVEKEKLNKVTSELAEEREKLTIQQERFQEIDTLYYSLKLAELKKNYEFEQQNISANEQKLAELDREFNSDEIRDRLEQNTSEIHGYFISLEEQLQKEKQDKLFEQKAIENKIEDQENQLKNHLEETEQLKTSLTSKVTLLEKNKQEMATIRSEILSNPQQESIEEQLPKWTELMNQLDTEIVQLEQRNKLLMQETLSLKNEMQEYETSLQQAQRQESEIATIKNQYEEEHNRIKLNLAEKKYAWTRLDSLYLKHDSIEKQLVEEIDKASQEYNELLYKERIAFRFVDDYANQDIFYADPYLSKQIFQWKNQFSYLETGVAYIQSLSTDSNYPLWPVTLITTEKEKDQLKEKVKHIFKHLQYPVNILSLDEASSIIQDDGLISANWVEPNHWRSNLDSESFHTWKEVIHSKANEAQQKSQLKLSELESWKQLEKEVHDFLQHYPFGNYQKLKEQHEELKDKIFNLERSLKKIKASIETNDREWNINKTRQSENKESIYGYMQKIEKGHKYINISKENANLESEKNYLTSKLQNSERKSRTIQRLITNYRDQFDSLKNEISEINTRITTKIYEVRLYQEVKNATPIFSSVPISLLEQLRQDLEFELKRLTKGRGEIEVAIEHSMKNIERYEKEMQQLRRENGSLNEDLVFPIHGTSKMNELWNERGQIETTISKLEDIVRRLTEKQNRMEGALQQLMKRVDNIILFDQPLAFIRKKIDEEQQSLQREKQRLDQSFSYIEKELTTIQEIVNELDKNNYKHLFLEPSIAATSLPLEAINEFNYNRKQITTQLANELDQSLTALDEEKNKVERARRKYIDECRRYISDIRMRETAIQGIESKQTYEEVLQYKELLEGRIQTATKYAEQNIRTHDQQLEQFIIHMHTHTRKIADELKIVPKKTKVKVDEQWKEIFSFHIPDWNETEGKVAIRAHILWILDQLEKDHYKDENGLDDHGKIRKDLSKWLQTKQLLRVVMKNQTMKVTCRKVTNDNRITSGSYSWEHSNVWSGGEKWSKNMTLFLGILNYIAEKSQHIQQPKMKRHRTVILDNPFGKASSDHILNPVFFIAEQLGFQIIALTAHAEGKFLRDYFPVIYSCRLRTATGNNKQIMTKEKSIQYAYFQDHAPSSLERLGEIEQLELLI